MPKLQKTNTEPKAYDLKRPFASLKSDHVPDGQFKVYNSYRDLTAWFSGDATTTVDSSRHAHTVSVGNSPTSGETTTFQRNFKIIHLNGSDQFLQWPGSNTGALDTLFDVSDGTTMNPFTLSAWINMDSMSGINVVMNRQQQWSLYVERVTDPVENSSNGQLRFLTHDDDELVHQSDCPVCAKQSNESDFICLTKTNCDFLTHNAVENNFYFSLTTASIYLVKSRSPPTLY